MINYTAQHIVDEDLRTICSCGGAWWHRSEPGVARRHLADDPTYAFPSVASICRHSCIYLHNYTDLHDVDENMKAIPEQGGRQDHETGTGIMLRDIYDTSTVGRDFVASSNI